MPLNALDQKNVDSYLLENHKAAIKKLHDQFIMLQNSSADEKAWNDLTEINRIEIEKKKLNILQDVYKSIEEQYGPSNRKLSSLNAEKKNSVWRRVLFGVLTVADIVISSIGGFLGAISLLKLIPGVSHAAGIVVSSIAVTIEGTARYSVFKPWLQKGLGMTPDEPKDTLVKHYEDRLMLTKKINSLMLNNLVYTAEKDPTVYQSYTGILKAANQDVRQIKLPPYKERTAVKVGRYCLSTLDVGLSAAGTYFSAVMLLTVVSAALLSTPPGWAIIAAAIVLQLVMRYVIRQSSIFTLLNPSAAQHEAVKDKLEKFTPKEQEFDRDLDLIKKAKKSSAVDVEKVNVKQALLRPNPVKPTRAAEWPLFFKPGLQAAEEPAIKSSVAFRR
jgi:hypothetical protein